MSIICYYHAYCQDGIGAAWSIYKKYPDSEFFPVIHDGSAPPGIFDGKDVIIVDFSFDRDTLLKMNESAKSIVLLDHHKSAQEKLGDLDFCHFDMNRSGAGMAWDYCFPLIDRPIIINYIEDQDLWRFKLPLSKETNAAIMSYSKTFFTLDMLNEKKNLLELSEEGKHILRYQKQLVYEIANKAQEIEFGSHKVFSVNSPILQSQVCHYLSKNKPFAIAWFENEKGDKIFSFRSDENGIDVSKIAAETIGGDGHFHSAGGRIKKGFWK